ncbi:hypothetical protein K438DRAFT_1929017 [Mycena galopus ATCC 62051]|nr:hypothetical protein K438DRAFT_1929017 [Mycena galopus ATCC 62051]
MFCGSGKWRRSRASGTLRGKDETVGGLPFLPLPSINNFGNTIPSDFSTKLFAEQTAAGRKSVIGASGGLRGLAFTDEDAALMVYTSAMGFASLIDAFHPNLAFKILWRDARRALNRLSLLKIKTALLRRGLIPLHLNPKSRQRIAAALRELLQRRCQIHTRVYTLRFSFNRNRLFWILDGMRWRWSWGVVLGRRCLSSPSPSPSLREGRVTKMAKWGWLTKGDDTAHNRDYVTAAALVRVTRPQQIAAVSVCESAAAIGRIVRVESGEWGREETNQEGEYRVEYEGIGRGTEARKKRQGR